MFKSSKRRRQICSPLKISQLINVELITPDRNNKGIYSCKKFIACSLKKEKCQLEQKKQDGEHLFLKALANRFWLTSKSCS